LRHRRCPRGALGGDHVATRRRPRRRRWRVTLPPGTRAGRPCGAGAALTAPGPLLAVRGPRTRGSPAAPRTCTSPHRSAAIPTCWCTPASSTRWAWALRGPGRPSWGRPPSTARAPSVRRRVGRGPTTSARLSGCATCCASGDRRAGARARHGHDRRGLFVPFDEVFTVPALTRPGDDHYAADPLGVMLIGERSGRRIRMGDPVSARVDVIDPCAGASRWCPRGGSRRAGRAAGGVARPGGDAGGEPGARTAPPGQRSEVRGTLTMWSCPPMA